MVSKQDKPAQNKGQNKAQSKGLGRGLAALIGDAGISVNHSNAEGAETFVRMLNLDQLIANPLQPRQHFDVAEIAELADSINQKGVLQPLIVRPAPQSRKDASALYEIVAGERRWRAAQQSQTHQVPVIIKELDDSAVLEIALIENIQRRDLNPIDEARALQKLIDIYGHSQAECAALLGKSRPHITNMMRLLRLSDKVQAYVSQGKLSAGHARALLGVTKGTDIDALARKIIQEGLNVRQVEQLGAKQMRKNTRRRPPLDADSRALIKELRDILGVDVAIKPNARRGKKQAGIIQLSYENFEQLDMLISLLRRRRG